MGEGGGWEGGGGESDGTMWGRLQTAGANEFCWSHVPIWVLVLGGINKCVSIIDPSILKSVFVLVVSVERVLLTGEIPRTMQR